jgi:DNA-binding winged helix-turn-helix (wHTH) protein
MVRFGVFEFDQRSGEVRKAGVRLALPDQSSRILAVLLEQPGELVSRKELRAQLWPADTFVDFEQGLNTAVRRLRETLGDSADAPRYIETLPRRGYRFIAPVDGQSPRPVREARSHGRLLLAATMLGVATFVLLTAYLTAPAAPPRPVVHLVANVHPASRLSSAVPLDSNPHLSFLRPSRTAIALSPDGRLLVFSGATGGATQLYVRRLASGEAEPLAGTVGADSPFFSPDGRWLGFWVDGQVRRVPIEGGRPPWSVTPIRCSAPRGRMTTASSLRHSTAPY